MPELAFHFVGLLNRLVGLESSELVKRRMIWQGNFCDAMVFRALHNHVRWSVTLYTVHALTQVKDVEEL